MMRKMRLLAAGLVMMLCLQVVMPLTVRAEYDTSWIGGEGNETFDELTDTVKETGNSMYKLFMAIGVVGLLISLIICGLLIAVSTNANKRSEHISHLIMICVGGILIFGAISIVGLLKTIGANI